MSQYNTAIVASQIATSKFYNDLFDGQYSQPITLSSDFNVSGLTTLQNLSTVKSTLSVSGNVQLGSTTSRVGFFGSSGTTKSTLVAWPTASSDIATTAAFVGSLRSTLVNMGLIA